MAERTAVPISPELCLVDPELAAWARLWSDDHTRHAPLVPTTVAAPRRSLLRARAVPIGLSALAVSLAFNVLTLAGSGVSLRPQQHVTADGRPELTWRPVEGAKGYDVILWRGRERVLDLWPKDAHVTLPARWRHRSAVLTPHSGRILWFVYPVLSRSPQMTFGPLVASGRLAA